MENLFSDQLNTITLNARKEREVTPELDIDIFKERLKANAQIGNHTAKFLVQDIKEGNANFLREQGFYLIYDQGEDLWIVSWLKP